MTFFELQREVEKYVYSEDDGMTRVVLASIIGARLDLGDPVWLLVIGPSSSGKSQLLRPLALTDRKFIHRIDDLTENTFLSGIQKGKSSKEISLLKRIGSRGIIVVSDFTVIFSKSSESRSTILSQLRMIYDGEMTKFSGNNPEPIHWEGSLGFIAGSTPSIYSHFEEVADMGERFIYYRMKPYNIENATRRSLERKIYGRELDEVLSGLYSQYVKEAVQKAHTETIPELSTRVLERIMHISMFAALIRTPTHYDKYKGVVDRIPTPEMPMRVALQLSGIARGFSIMNFYDTGSWELSEEDMGYVEWCAYSLANEERRACLKVLAGLAYMGTVSTQTIADAIGLDTSVTRTNLQHLGAIGVLSRSGENDRLVWRIHSRSVWEAVRRLEGIEKTIEISDRNATTEEPEEMDEKMIKIFDAF